MVIFQNPQGGNVSEQSRDFLENSIHQQFYYNYHSYNRPFLKDQMPIVQILSSKRIAKNTVMVDYQYILYELHDAFSLNTTIPDQFDIFLWLSDQFCLNKGQEGCISRIV